MGPRRDVFQAIADPTRREIINLIAAKPRNVISIAENFDMTRQAISLQVKILQECGLIEIKQVGRERMCEARLEKLAEVTKWIDQAKKYWHQQFHSLEKYLERVQKTKKGRK